MSQLGASGKPILLKANFFIAQELTDGDILYSLHGRFTEPYMNGGPFDGEATPSTVNTANIQMPESEIIAQNKDVMAAYIADRYNDPTFTVADIRGGDNLPFAAP